jgi:hypothetical protein
MRINKMFTIKDRIWEAASETNGYNVISSVFPFSFLLFYPSDCTITLVKEKPAQTPIGQEARKEYARSSVRGIRRGEGFPPGRTGRKVTERLKSKTAASAARRGWSPRHLSPFRDCSRQRGAAETSRIIIFSHAGVSAAFSPSHSHAHARKDNYAITL